jgi:hypothetical protein
MVSGTVGEFLLVGVRVVLGCLVLLEQVLRDVVDPLVRTLRGEDDGDEQFESVGEVQRDGRVGVRLVQAVEDDRDLFLPGVAWGAHGGTFDGGDMSGVVRVRDSVFSPAADARV